MLYSAHGNVENKATVDENRLEPVVAAMMKGRRITLSMSKRAVGVVITSVGLVLILLAIFHLLGMRDGDESYRSCVAHGIFYKSDCSAWTLQAVNEVVAVVVICVGALMYNEQR